MTGKTSDHRQPEDFSNLMATVQTYGLSDCSRVLGVIPYNDLIALMRNSLAVINPSLFEGWSSSVEEAKSLGKRVILSDIPIHREQDPAAGIFFKPHDAEWLAEVMERIMRNPPEPEEELRMLEAARDYLLPRKIGFAENYQKIVLSLFDYSRT